MLEKSLKEKLITKEQAERLYEGFDFSSYLWSGRDIKNQASVRLYRRYEFIFKILPRLPSGVRKKISPTSIRWIPSFLMFPITFFIDMIIFRNNPIFIEYRNHYIFHLKRFFYKKFTGKKLKAVDLYH